LHRKARALPCSDPLLRCYRCLLLCYQDLLLLLLCRDGRLLLRLQSSMSSRFLVCVPRRLQYSALRLGLVQTPKFNDALPLQIAAFRSPPFQWVMVAAGEGI
jgi:hypothetical protein